MHATRMERARARMGELGVDALCVSVGPDLPYLTGYAALPLERLTMLVVPRQEQAVLVVPELEAPRVVDRPGVFTVRPWSETEDPVQLVADQVRGAGVVAIGDQTWARFVLALEASLPEAHFVAANRVTAPLRVVKDADEVAALQRAASAVDEIAASLRDRPFGGRSERDIAREVVDRMLDHGHERANFAIVASGPNGASPHHEPAGRVIEAGDVVVCDFGGTMDGYCSDITRMYAVGVPAPEVRDDYEVLAEAQEAVTWTRSRAAPSTRPDSASSSYTAPATGSAWRRTRTHTSWPTTRAPCEPATCSALNRASTCLAASVSAWRTSWSPPRTGRDGSTRHLGTSPSSGDAAACASTFRRCCSSGPPAACSGAG
jgi:Xaa-Pro aminopeptidase